MEIDRDLNVFEAILSLKDRQPRPFKFAHVYCIIYYPSASSRVVRVDCFASLTISYRAFFPPSAFILFSSNSEAAYLRSTEVTPPVTSIPPEFLCCIFTYVLPVQNGTSPAIPTRRRRNWREPWVLGDLVKSARTGVRSRCQCRLCGRPFTVANNLSPPKFFVLKTQLAQTGSAPINLLIYFTSGARTHAGAPSSTAVATARRLRNPEWANPPSPRRVDIQWRSKIGPELRLLQSHASTPAGCTGEPRWAPMPNIPSPWEKLMSYKGTNPAPTIHFCILAAAANLVECDIDFGKEMGPSEVLQRDFLTLPLLTLSRPSLFDRLTATDL
ncbi:hypothetical protein B0H13DRAFT_1893824 [Mycena leptocephala]|nr:hypothetical protein B0H13DRAFT_1893824 [Mycena leptocephala]